MIDLTGAPYIVEQAEDGKWYILGIHLRKRDFFFNAGIPDEVMQKLTGKNQNGNIDTLEEMEEFLEGQPEGSRLSDQVPDEFATDQDMKDAWQEALENARQNHAGSQQNNS